jgi:hypothetical protein
MRLSCSPSAMRNVPSAEVSDSAARAFGELLLQMYELYLPPPPAFLSSKHASHEIPPLSSLLSSNLCALSHS